MGLYFKAIYMHLYVTFYVILLCFPGPLVENSIADQVIPD